MEDTRTETPNWAMVNTDSIIHAMERIPEHSLDCSIYSPPFPAMYAYNDSEADLGNVEDLTPESLWHFKFFFSGMLRVMKPGRVMVVHCCQIPRMKRVGGVGMHDFRGMLIRLGERAGFIYEYDWAIRKNPQALAHGTGVLTPSGYRLIESLQVGDEVIGSNGKPTRVKGVYPHGVRKMFSAEIGHKEIFCDANHLWKVRCKDGSEAVLDTERLFLRISFGEYFRIPKISVDSIIEIDSLRTLAGDIPLERFFDEPGIHITPSRLEKECTCIEVEADDRLYVIEGGVVTHNSQAIRTRSRELQFSGLERDRAKSRGAIPDYLIKFIAPGVNAVPIRDPDDIPILDAEGNPVLDENGRPTYDDSRRTVSRNDWINWAEPAWMDIRETDTLKVRGTKEEDDTRHICPLQLPVIDRLVKLFSNPGETVFSPFAGIGSEGVIALRNGRKFLGCELKSAYYLTACANLRIEEERIAAGIVLASEQAAITVETPEAVEILDAPEFDDSEEALPVDEVPAVTDKGSMVDPMSMSYAASDGVAPDDGLVQPSFWDSLAPGAEPLTGEDLLNDWERRNGLPVNHAAEADAFDELVNAAVPSSESDPLDSIDDDLADLF